jgi:hypothetical protein
VIIVAMTHLAEIEQITLLLYIWRTHATTETPAQIVAPGQPDQITILGHVVLDAALKTVVPVANLPKEGNRL